MIFFASITRVIESTYLMAHMDNGSGSVLGYVGGGVDGGWYDLECFVDG